MPVKAIQHALEASKTCGPTSKEARVAWDIVEEMDSSDNSAAFTEGMEEECLDWMDQANQATLSQACSEYDLQIQELEEKLKATRRPVIKKNMERKQTMAAETRAVKLLKSKGKANPPSPAVHRALEAAQEAQTQYGKQSVQARLAWEELEEISAADTSNAYGPRLGEECLVESAMEACITLEELNRVLNLENTKGDNGPNS